jgi:hypothetical protein
MRNTWISTQNDIAPSQATDRGVAQAVAGP